MELPENEVSGEQAMIYYEKGNWYIKDGGKEKASGSGTWLFLDKRYEITNDIIFMVGSSTLKLEYIPAQPEIKTSEVKNENIEDKKIENTKEENSENNKNES